MVATVVRFGEERSFFGNGFGIFEYMNGVLGSLIFLAIVTLSGLFGGAFSSPGSKVLDGINDATKAPAGRPLPARTSSHPLSPRVAGCLKMALKIMSPPILRRPALIPKQRRPEHLKSAWFWIGPI
jgi:hypothetical protein